jgi:hypothetical protein
MLGFGKVSGLNRQEYNTRVKDILERQFGIETNHSINPRFPAILAFADVIAQGWYSNSSPEDTAVDISLRYIVGGLKAGGEALEEARSLSEPVLAFLTEAATAGKISDFRAQAMITYYDEHSWRLIQPVHPTPGRPAEPNKETVTCPSCGKASRVPTGKRLRIKCPRCEQSWVQETSESNSVPKPSAREDKDLGADATTKKQTAWKIVRPKRS